MKIIILVMMLLSITISYQNVLGDKLEDCDRMNVGDNIWNKGLVVNLQEECFSIDCSNISYPTDIEKTLKIMKFCTGGEKEVN